MKVAVPANLAAPAKRQLRSGRNSKVSSGSDSASEDGRNGSSASEEGSASKGSQDGYR